MLQTLLKIGEWQSQGKSKWDRFLEYPKIETEDKNGNKITNYTLPIIFDLDEQEVIIDKENLEEYDERKIEATIPIKVKGGNNKAFYTSVPAAKLNQIYKTFFGKYDEDSRSGELIEAIEKQEAKLLSNDFKVLLCDIFELKNRFIEQTLFTKKNGDQEISIKRINEDFELSRNENIVFLITKVKAERYHYEKPTFFSKVFVYKSFLEESFFGKEKEKFEIKAIHKLCYASGAITRDVEQLDISNRYNINKMFVTETKNYASVFDKKKFPLNYQVSAKNQELLDYASDFLLNHGYKVRIANLDHVIIPQFLATTDVNLENALNGIQIKSDLLFNMKAYKEIPQGIEDEINENDIFWVNFLAFESDGNFFKSTEVIKDVSNFYFNEIIDSFDLIDIYFRETDFVNWDKVMTSYDYETKTRISHRFNFNSLFKIIPLRKDKEKKNKALDLFKTILENRKVDRAILFDYFTELILCHYYERYESYTNTDRYSKDYFGLAIRDSIFKYIAFFQFLKNLNLIDMEETTSIPGNNNHQDENVQHFFTEMDYTQEQKAMFFLGRMLSSVEFIQEGKNRTVIQKVNFNGMDKDDIQRLRTGLIEKAKQYNAMAKVIFTDNKFGEQFDYNHWELNPKEALFFLLTGYSFGARAKDNNDSETKGSN